MIKRAKIQEYLKDWKNTGGQYLFVTGMSKVGKTTELKEFLKNNFDIGVMTYPIGPQELVLGSKELLSSHLKDSGIIDMLDNPKALLVLTNVSVNLYTMQDILLLIKELSCRVIIETDYLDRGFERQVVYEQIAENKLRITGESILPLLRIQPLDFEEFKNLNLSDEPQELYNMIGGYPSIVQSYIDRKFQLNCREIMLRELQDKVFNMFNGNAYRDIEYFQASEFITYIIDKIRKGIRYTDLLWKVEQKYSKVNMRMEDEVDDVVDILLTYGVVEEKEEVLRFVDPIYIDRGD